MVTTKRASEDIMTELSSQQSVPQEGILLHELNHRINNEFAAVISVVSLVAARSANNEVKTALSGVAELLHRYADVHRALQAPEHDIILDAETYLRQLCLSISRSYLDHRKVKLVLATEPLQLRADRCRRLGMIVYELVINSARHAFSGGEGEIRVQLLRGGAIAQCRVVDNGSFATTAASGRGLKIIEALSQSLGGWIIQKFGPLGSRSILTFPCDIEPEAARSEANAHLRKIDIATDLGAVEPDAGVKAEEQVILCSPVNLGDGGNVHAAVLPSPAGLDTARGWSTSAIEDSHR
jgi:two-component sensor histidine kinase